MAKVTLESGEGSVEVEAPAGATLLDAIRLAQLPFSAPCAGKGTCGKCQVSVQTSSARDLVFACKTEVSEGMYIEVNADATVIDLELLQPANADNLHGVAIDLGTTTLAANLVDMQTGELVAHTGRMNPQLVFGADVISRIEASDAGNLQNLQKLIVDALRGMILALCKAASLSKTHLKEIVLAGNTVMEHLASGLSPVSIGVSPYLPLDYFGKDIVLWEDLPPVWFAPCISGYVGGDVVAGMLAKHEVPFLLLDLGTNGELALQTASTSVAAATAAGPVFEGMNVRFGMPAFVGALSEARYSDATGELHVEVIGGVEAKGICGSGLVDLIAIMLINGLIDESGRLLTPEECDSPLAEKIVTFEDTLAFRPIQGSEVAVTQRDIRNMQLAKAAIAAGIEIVLESANLPLEKLSSLAIAGNFGHFLHKEHAAQLGLIPAEALGISTAIGNSSLSGACEALLDAELRQRMVSMARTTCYVELSTDARFTNRFISNMGFEEANA